MKIEACWILNTLFVKSNNFYQDKQNVIIELVKIIQNTNCWLLFDNAIWALTNAIIGDQKLHNFLLKDSDFIFYIENFLTKSDHQEGLSDKKYLENIIWCLYSLIVFEHIDVETNTNK